MNKYKPSFKITDRSANLLYLIAETLTSIKYVNDLSKYPRLVRNNRIKSIRSSIAIENNILTLNEVTDVLNGKRVLAPQDQILEAKNCFNAYECLDDIEPYSVKDLVSVHSLMVRSMCKEAGMLRKTNVGVYAGATPIHIAPKPEIVEKLINNLFEWVKTTQTNFIIASCVFHFEFEFIHPFADGNGRMGRLWQTALLSKHIPLFKYLPIEEIIFNNRPEYYHALRVSQNEGESTKFVEFMLNMIYQALLKMKKEIDEYKLDYSDQINKILKVVDKDPKSAKEIMKILKLKNQPSFFYNYLKPALESKLIKMTNPDKPKSKNQKYYK